MDGLEFNSKLSSDTNAVNGETSAVAYKLTIMDSLTPILGASATADAVSAPTTVECLPTEILTSIFNYLDSPQPSATGILDEPTFDLTNAETANLKAISLISRRWRHTVLPVLFRHSRFIVRSAKDRYRSALHENVRPFLDFISQNILQKAVISFVLLVQDEKIANNIKESYHLNEVSSFWNSLFQIIDPTELLIIAPAEALGELTCCHVYLHDRWSFDCPYQYLRLQQCSIVKSNTTQSGESTTSSSASKPMVDDTSKIGISVEPVHNSPENLLRRPLDTTSQVAQPESHSTPSTSRLPLEERQFTRAESSALFDVRPWTTLLLNEGSFVKAYSTYEFWVRQPPSILSELLGADEETPRGPCISPTIRDFSYIGIFPMASHFKSLTQHLPRIDRLYVQLVPRPLDILENPERMEMVDSEDLWMERNSCYALLMRELFNSPPLLNYRSLEIFESGDAADTDAWQMAVEYVKRAGMGWKVAAEGILTRDPKDLFPEPGPGEDEEGSSFQGALIKWAWNGTTRLPVSAYPLYDHPMGPVV